MRHLLPGPGQSQGQRTDAGQHRIVVLEHVRVGHGTPFDALSARTSPETGGRRPPAGVSLGRDDRNHLRRCVELAAAAVEAGDEPFGSVLVAADGRVLFEDRNRVAGGDRTQHPEFALARWAVQHLDGAERAAATVYTSGEHCPMCAAAHGWVGLGRIVYAASSAQLTEWLAGLGAPPAPVAPLPITTVVPEARVDGPAPELTAEVGALVERWWAGRRG